MRILDGRIVEIGPQPELELRYPDEERLDARGQYVMPGNICAHTHFYGAFAPRAGDPRPCPEGLPRDLAKTMVALDRSLKAEDVRASAEVMLVDAIRHGTTTLIDHHASPNAIDGSLDWIADVVDRSGLRAVLCYEVTDRDGAEKMRKGIDENVRFIRRAQDGAVASGRVRGDFWSACRPDPLGRDAGRLPSSRARRVSDSTFTPRSTSRMNTIAWESPGFE